MQIEYVEYLGLTKEQIANKNCTCDEYSEPKSWDAVYTSKGNWRFVCTGKANGFGGHRNCPAKAIPNEQMVKLLDKCHLNRESLSHSQLYASLNGAINGVPAYIRAENDYGSWHQARRAAMDAAK